VGFQAEVQFQLQETGAVGKKVALVDLVAVAPHGVALEVAVVGIQAVAVAVEVVTGAQVVVAVHF
jgi:hypothetical protein